MDSILVQVNTKRQPIPIEQQLVGFRLPFVQSRSPNGAFDGIEMFLGGTNTM